MNKTIGKPLYKRGDIVIFHVPKVKDWNGNLVHDEMDIEGVIEIVDAYGTFEQNEQPSYDIYVKENNTLYKHIVEESVKKKVRDAKPEELIQ